MKISPREILLAWGTALTVLAAASYLVAEPRLKDWNRLLEQAEETRRQAEIAQRSIEQRAEWVSRMEEVRKSLPNHSAERDVTAEYMRILERLAMESDIKLLQRKPDREKKEGEDLYVLGATCTWEGGLGALVRFLLALKQQNVTMDVHELSLSVATGEKGGLKGNFSINCAYTKNAEKNIQHQEEEEPAPEP